MAIVKDFTITKGGRDDDASLWKKIKNKFEREIICDHFWLSDHASKFWL